ncbi:MAG: TIGR03016 family PEP-CTERM system-associated outer membrane protein [Rhodoferax sp.]|nr:TIGR03016 family PEP-CTERM system-associated outer membrane protein [Rhodoferax sp.]
MPMPISAPGPVPRVLAMACAAVLAGAVSGAAVAQQAGARPKLEVTPALSVTQTLTDSYRAKGATVGDGRSSEAITSISPGLRVTSRAGRVQGVFDYGLIGVLHARDSTANEIQHRLSASGRAELVPNHLDLNASASISRQPTSAFGVQSVDGSLTANNQSDVRTLSLQPVLRGVLGGVVAVQASGTASRTDGGSQVGSRSTGASLTLSPAAAGRVISWSLTGSRQISDFEGGRKTTTDRAIASVIVRPDAELQVSVRGGVERSDLASLESRESENYGAGILWTPTPRTRVSIDGDRRQFGDAHQVALEHRFRRSVWRYSDSRSVNDGSTSNSAGSQITAYALFFELFASQEPDPVARDLLVRSFLERNGVSPDTLLGGGGFVTGAVSIQRRQELSFALSGVRTTFTAAVFQTTSERGDTLSSADDDLATGPVRQRGLSVSVTHRLTPTTGLNFNVSSQRSRSLAAAGRNNLDSVALGWNSRLSRQSTLSLNVRHAEYDSDTEPYTENAVTAAFSTRF